jgi:hypothetical protein
VGSAQPVQAATLQKLDLRVLVVDDGSAWVGAIASTLKSEGVPSTVVHLADSGRSSLTADFLATGTEGHYQAVVLPDGSGGGLTAAEVSALTAYEASFGVRQVDAFTWANPAVGLSDASTNGFVGSLDGKTATVTPAGLSGGFGYLSGSLPMSPGSYGYVAQPLTSTSTPALPAGASFTPLVTTPISGTSVGSLIGTYTAGGISQLVITMNYNAGQQHYRAFSHGIVSWMTQGVHFGLNRNYFTFHFDDAFAPDARWDAANSCTPGEDCPSTVAATPDIRMTAADVDHIVTWEQTSGYVPTLAFNGYYAQYDSNGNAYSTPDALTTALVTNKSAFHWLNHGYQHIYQGCQQDFTVIPWRCVTTPAGQTPAADGSNVVWTSQSDISNEISQNIAVGQSLGLPFTASEYLSGEHSGLLSNPQQPVDNPNFGAALSANGIAVTGADASRESSTRQVGSAQTLPRHPTALYYNTSTAAEAVSEYNYIYLPAGAGGKCVASSTTTCLTAPVDATTGFGDYIVPTDAVYDLSFILSNDPRPFYAHVSNLTGPDYLGLQLIDKILSLYNASFAANAPLQNLTETQAVDVLAKQSAWAGQTDSPSVTGYIQDGQVVVTNTTGVSAPVTVPAGTTVTGTGAAFGAGYGGELSSWTQGSQTLTLPGGSTSTGGGSTGGGSTGGGSTGGGTTGGGMTGGGTTGGGTTGGGTTGGGTTPSTGGGDSSGGSTPPSADAKPWFKGAAAATFRVGYRSTVRISTGAAPAATVRLQGKLPTGVKFTAAGNGTATLSGTPAAGTAKVYPLVLIATNRAGTVKRGFVLTVASMPRFTSPTTVSVRPGQRFRLTVRTTSFPAVTRLSASGLPRGVTFRSNRNGTATLSGTITRRGTRTVTISAVNIAGRTIQRLVIRVR